MTGLAVALAALAMALGVAGVVLHLVPGELPAGGYGAWWVTNAAGALAIALPGALLAARRPRNPLGWLLLALALAHGVTAAGREYALHALAPGSALPLGRAALWVSGWTYTDFPLLVPLLFLFPDGTLPSRRWRPAFAATWALAIAATGWVAVQPGPMLPSDLAAAANPLPWSGYYALLAHLGDWLEWLLVASLLVGIGGILLRARAADGPARRSLVLVAVAATILALELGHEDYRAYAGMEYAGAAVEVLLAAAIALAILRYGLYAIDLVVSRTLVYGGLTVVLGLVYVSVVALAQDVIHSDVLGSVPAAILVALLFAPARAWLQRASDRLLFGAREDPYAVIASVSRGLATPDLGAVLPALAQTIAETLKLPSVAIELDREDGAAVVAQTGAPRGEPVVLVLRHAGERVGRLLLGPRSPGERFTARELRLFTDIARQAAVAAYAVRLTEDLQRSRGELVAAREEERRRLRRDLHDGLGPTLAGISLQVATARVLAKRDPAAADALLGRLVEESQAAIADVRRLVYALRPPALDELGLVPALRMQADRFPGLAVAVVAPESLERLPAAVEVAVYRIATEALTNVSRHAAASHCTITLGVNGGVELEVRDDGAGMAAGWQPGVGVASIRERAAELGGSCTITGADGGGTCIVARLPLGTSAAAGAAEGV
jgi:signal transduction histidine kinase